MKTFILLLLLASLIACEDKTTYCFKCSVIETMDDGSEEASEFTRCDITQEECDDIVRNGTEIWQPYEGYNLIAFKKKTTCVKN